MKKTLLNILLFTGFIALFGACNKDQSITTDPNDLLAFSSDTVFFDTVFTSLNSVTLNFKVYNRNSDAINISEIRLEGGETSFYRMNVNGNPDRLIKDELLAGGDSIFIFVEVTIDPTNQNNPLLVEDSISFSFNGNYQTVRLLAFGQDAVIYYPDTFIDGLPPFTIISNDSIGPVTWTSEKPILIFSYAVVDEGGSLTIEPGTQIFFHAFSGLWVFENSEFIANGTTDQQIVFQGDRTEEIFDDEPGQWDRIWINRSNTDHYISNALIKNALIGIQAEASPFDSTGGSITDNTLYIDNVTITHCSARGIFGRNFKIEANNVAIGNCGQYTVAISGGGEYRFNNCTFSNYWNLEVRETPSFAMINQYQIGGVIYEQQISNSYVINSIIDGNLANEFQLELSGENNSFTSNYTIIKTDQTLPDDFNNIYLNQNPQLIDPAKSDFRPSEDAFVLGKANPATATLSDITGSARPADPAVGAYEYHPE
jgi:hypothetical protein